MKVMLEVVLPQKRECLPSYTQMLTTPSPFAVEVKA